jgi:hypothetical protein
VGLKSGRLTGWEISVYLNSTGYQITGILTPRPEVLYKWSMTTKTFTLTSDHGHGGGLVGYPTFKVSEDQMLEVFGKPNSPMSYCEEDKGYTGYWDFTCGEQRISIGFRHGCSRYSGYATEDANDLDAFLKNLFT